MDILEEGLEKQAIGLKSMLIAYRGFTHKHRYILATIVTSILFGLVHFQGSWITCLMTGLLGLAFAIVTLKVNRLYPAIFGHIFHNSIVFVILAMSR
jgi:membrane protease YdiL (CAAX protease family)